VTLHTRKEVGSLVNNLGCMQFLDEVKLKLKRMPNKEGHPSISKNSLKLVPVKYMFSKLNNIHSLQVTNYHTLQA
jgi:hypothetical protein